jgi:hypothetical protein
MTRILTINGVQVTEEQFNAFEAEEAKRSAANRKAFEDECAAATGQDVNTVAIAPNKPSQLDNGAQVKTEIPRPPDAFTNRDRQSDLKNPNLIYSSLGPSVQPANGGIDARLATYGLNLNASPNPLSDYATYTYHIRWFMTSEYESYNKVNEQNPNSSNMTKTVIAESGVTAGFNIVDLEFKQQCAGNGESRNMWTSTEFEMTISEPLGLSLFDKIYYSSQQLNLINHMRCPYFLEIWFTGYDEDGISAPDQLFYTMYRVNLTSCEATTTQVGTTYHFKMVVDNTVGEKNISATPQAALAISCENLGSFFDQLAQKMNDQQGQVNADGIPRITYKFEYPSQWRNWNIRPADTDKHSSRNSGSTVSGNWISKGSTINIAKGQAVENIVNFAVYQCQEARDWITGASVPGGGNQSDHAIIGYVSVYAATKIVGFDVVTKDYLREITYTLFRTESTKSFTDQQNVIAAQKAQTQLQKLRYLVQQKRLAKRYDYIYTGLNTEVITFDFKMNFQWFFSQPTWNQGNSYGQAAVAKVADDGSQDFRERKGTQTQKPVPPVAAQPQTPDGQIPGSTNLVGLPANVPNLAAGQQLPTKLVPQAGQPTTSSAASPSDNIVKFDQSTGQLALTAAQQKNPALSQLQNNVNNYLTNRAATLATKYVEDASLTQLEKNPPLPLVAVFDPKPQLQNAQQNTDQTKTNLDQDPNAFASGTGYVASIMGNIFSQKGDNFQEIQLGIRGDPWWIAQSNIKLNSLAKELTNNPTTPGTEDYKANVLGGDNCFLLEMRVGVVIDEETGLARSDNQGADFFTGIYSVVTVSNSFKEGKFTQILDARKDILAQNPISQQAEGSSSPAAAAGGNAPIDPIQNFEQMSAAII